MLIKQTRLKPAERAAEQSACGARHRVVIVGGGFGGLNAAKTLSRSPVEVTLIDRRNFHLFQPLLYQVATGGLSPGDIASPLRGVLERRKNVQVLMGEAIGFDVGRRHVVLRDGEIPYDTLIVAAGAVNSYFGHDDWRRHAPGLKTVEDATGMRRRVLLAFENAEKETNPDRVREWLTFVIIGGGPTGLELAGALAEIARHTLKHEFRRINPGDARILVIEGGERLLTAYPSALSSKAERSLRRLGVTVITGALATAIDACGVTVRRGDGAEERISARTVLWAAGIRAAPLGEALAAATGTTTDRMGRVFVESDCTIAGHPEIFVIGDLAHFRDETGRPLPGVAPVALQQGKYAAKSIHRRLRRGGGGKVEPQRPFRYFDKGSMATIGRHAAVADIRGLKFSGYPAWLAWLFVHLILLVEFENRLLVLIQWAWNYLTWNRSARLITEPGETAPTAADSVKSLPRAIAAEKHSKLGS